MLETVIKLFIFGAVVAVILVPLLRQRSEVSRIHKAITARNAQNRFAHFFVGVDGLTGIAVPQSLASFVYMSAGEGKTIEEEEFSFSDVQLVELLEDHRLNVPLEESKADAISTALNVASGVVDKMIPYQMRDSVESLALKLTIKKGETLRHCHLAFIADKTTRGSALYTQRLASARDTCAGLKSLVARSKHQT